MRGLTFIKRKHRHLLTIWYSQRFRTKCTQVGHNLLVLGPCFVHGSGQIKIGHNFTVRSQSFNRVEISSGRAACLTIGNHVFINQGVRIACSQTISIGNHCMIGDETIILDNDYHPVNSNSPKCAPVYLEDRVWLATRVIVLRGVRVGEGSVIGAGSVVTQSIPPYSFAAGVPARVIKSLKK